MDVVKTRFTEPSFIDYRKLADALDHYESRGYNYREVPWVISKEAMAVTLPPGRPATAVQYGDLVGSAEQSFIELLLRGQSITKACAITPCFRIEESYDRLHHAYFMKMELINTDTSNENLQQMVQDATAFFQKYIPAEVDQTGPDAYDIIDKRRRIELGSYGIRQFNMGHFIYGTGVALPRLSVVSNFY